MHNITQWFPHRNGTEVDDDTMITDQRLSHALSQLPPQLARFLPLRVMSGRARTAVLRLMVGHWPDDSPEHPYKFQYSFESQVKPSGPFHVAL